MTAQEAIDLLDTLDGMIEDNHNSDYDSAFKMAIKALEKQIPNDCKRIGATQLKCICGSVIKLHRYCPYCGQKLDWGDYK